MCHWILEEVEKISTKHYFEMICGKRKKKFSKEMNYDSFFFGRLFSLWKNALYTRIGTKAERENKGLKSERRKEGKER